MLRHWRPFVNAECSLPPMLPIAAHRGPVADMNTVAVADLLSTFLAENGLEAR